MNNDKKTVSIGKAANMLGVCNDTLRQWEKEGKIFSFKTVGNHRRYFIEDIELMVGKTKILPSHRFDNGADWDAGKHTIFLSITESGFHLGLVTNIGNGPLHLDERTGPYTLQQKDVVLQRLNEMIDDYCKESS